MVVVLIIPELGIQEMRITSSRPASTMQADHRLSKIPRTRDVA